MNITYFFIHHDTNEKNNDKLAPIYGIKLKDLDMVSNKTANCMSTQLKDFSIAMQKCGLAWSEKYQEYIIPNNICYNKILLEKYLTLIDTLLKKINNGENVVSNDEIEREKNQSFYTRKSAVKYLQSFLKLNLNQNDNVIILDPAAGDGRLLDGLNIPTNSIWAIEPNENCCKILKQKGYQNIVNTSFEAAIKTHSFPTPTHIIMNPPFSHQQDIKFYNQACNILKNGGVISAIVSENSIYKELNKIKRIIYR